ncbi:hypothetical protein KSZ_01170 [Dictyobacter formicarum]|uniref:Uncharacterized protein n=1 Tax=Dictyobacter formicarum TaxID=2778368 RepID=A0ABQ3VA55_9CHLR|nr:hypothetical protein KSZ_01170 [Dictyobacter formicarum]
MKFFEPHIYLMITPYISSRVDQVIRKVYIDGFDSMLFIFASTVTFVSLWSLVQRDKDKE